MRVIAHIETCFATKFGVPRQAGIVHTPGRIIFEKEYRNADAFRGLADFDYIWLLWQFSESLRDGWNPTVRPPRLGGNARMGVFATRSPFRPNPIGLSSVRLLRVAYDNILGPILHISGADLMNGTPIYDIKPYIPYTDCHPDARSGFAIRPADSLLQVHCDRTLLDLLPQDMRQPLLDILAHDPRPRYQHDAMRQYGMTFAKHDIHFSVEGDKLTVLSISAI